MRPGVIESFVYALAHSFHFTEHQILWEIPYSRALRYVHASLWANGAWTIKPKTAPKLEFEKLLKFTEIYDDGDDI